MTTIRRVLGLLDVDERHQVQALLALLALIVVMALLEVVGIASIAPFLALVGNPSLVHEQGLLGRAYDVLGFTDTQAVLILIGAASLAALLISNAFSAFMISRRRSFANPQGSRMSTPLLRTYLSRPYAFFLGRYCSELARSILTKGMTVMKGGTMPGLGRLAKGVATVCIVALVVTVHASLALVVVAKFKTANEAFGAIKDLKVMGRDAFRDRRFQDAAVAFARANKRSQVIPQVSHYALEKGAPDGVLVVLITLLGTGHGLEKVSRAIGSLHMPCIG